MDKQIVDSLPQTHDGNTQNGAVTRIYIECATAALIVKRLNAASCHRLSGPL